MAIRDAHPLVFSPHGLTDSFDESDSFPGACRQLTNLIFDSGNPDQVVARPGVGAPITTFPGFTTPGFVSVYAVIGNMVYGMLATGRTVGYDEPFAFNLVSSTFVTISGVTAGNVPLSPPSTGAWTPPTMAAVGKKIIFAHAGFSGVGSNFFGILDVTNPAAPAWSAANTTVNVLPAVPTAVANFNNRAYYVVGNVLYGSDALNPTVITNLSSTVTIGDTTPITALNGLPMQTTSSGITANLVIFKANQIWALAGDTTTSNLSLNFLSLNVGCPHPRSVVQTVIGTLFISQDAPCVLSVNGGVAELKHPNHGSSDVRIPFQNSTVPSRTTAAFVGNIYRVCVVTIINGITASNDYWFDIRRMRWTGPHSFPYDSAGQYNDTCILSGVGSGAALFNGPPNDVTTNTTYNDNGVAMLTTLVTTSLHDGDVMEFKQTVESSIDVTSGGTSTPFTITAYDDQGTTLGTATVTTPPPASVWGGFNWGDGTLYSTVVSNPRRYDVAWNQPLVWDRMYLTITAPGATDVSIGKFKAKYQHCGYSLRAVALPGTIPAVVAPPAGVLLDKNFVLNQSKMG